MTRGAFISFVLHVAVALIAYLGLPFITRPEAMLERPLMVDIVTIAAVTNLPEPTPKVTPKPEPKAVEKPPEPPKPEPPRPETPKAELPPPPPPPPPKVEPPRAEPPKPEPIKPEPPKPAEVKPEPAPKVAEPKPEPKPEPPKAEAKIEPPKPEPPKPEPPKQVAKIEPPRPAPRKPEPPKKDDTFDQLLKDLTRRKPASEPSEAKPKPEPPKPQQQAALPPTPNQSPPPRPMVDGQLTLSELDAIRSQIAQCWNVPAGARDARNLAVELQVEMNPDATVRQAVIVDQSRMATDPFFRSAAESAMRAVLNPRCNPLRLPKEKYDTWKSFLLNFNPKEML